MAILYVFTYNDPQNVGAFPPSMIDTPWERQIREFARTTPTLTPLAYPSSSLAFFIFANVEELTNFLNTYRLTDTKLLQDIADWKAAYNVSYATYFYEISETSPLSISVEPLVS